MRGGVERKRRTPWEQRLAVALDLHEMSSDIAREGIRRNQPDADPSEVERLLHRRLELARSTSTSMDRKREVE
jgi:hypothetical protein